MHSTCGRFDRLAPVIRPIILPVQALPHRKAGVGLAIVGGPRRSLCTNRSVERANATNSKAHDLFLLGREIQIAASRTAEANGCGLVLLMEWGASDGTSQSQLSKVARPRNHLCLLKPKLCRRRQELFSFVAQPAGALSL